MALENQSPVPAWKPCVETAVPVYIENVYVAAKICIQVCRKVKFGKTKAFRKTTTGVPEQRFKRAGREF